MFRQLENLEDCVREGSGAYMDDVVWNASLCIRTVPHPVCCPFLAGNR